MTRSVRATGSAPSASSASEPECGQGSLAVIAVLSSALGLVALWWGHRLIPVVWSETRVPVRHHG